MGRVYISIKNESNGRGGIAVNIWVTFLPPYLWIVDKCALFAVWRENASCSVL